VDRKVEEYRQIVQSVLEGQHPQADSDMVTAQATLDRSEIDCYRKGAIERKYAAVQKFLKDPSTDQVIQALKNAGLLGMGGAGAPAFSKWDEARTAPGETKYVVCNADESEPGTFKDREILLAAPHLVIEGMTMAALVSGAKQGYIYIRHEYEEQIEKLRQAIQEAERYGALGTNTRREAIGTTKSTARIANQRALRSTNHSQQRGDVRLGPLNTTQRAHRRKRDQGAIKQPDSQQGNPWLVVQVCRQESIQRKKVLQYQRRLEPSRSLRGSLWYHLG
jgi:Na+-translocating ferredoxin:NAD+ oxidoreductase RnfC subunit